ncbi:MAG: carbohydrate-binding protein [Fibrobacter sp.]|nr:carbohydrate-binding protein [Fibrobacter sp.]
MDFKKVSGVLTLAGGLMMLASVANAAPDPNFHVYIAYGQSNMAGAGDIRKGTDDKEHPRYKMFATTSCTKYPTVGEIYPAVPPMFHCGEGLSVADWFGRYLADSLPDVTVGVIPVAVGGTKIELFDKDKYASYLSTAESWLVNWAKDYGSEGNAHARIVEVAKKAQQVGVIKGFIFHQGESGAMNGNNWQQEVKKTRDDILKALDLSSDTVPFLAGGLEDRAAGGCCWSFTDNNIKTLPNVMDNTYFVSSEGLKGNGKDSYHFSSESYQEFGRRYAAEMLKHISTVPVEPEPQTPFGGKAAEIPGKIEAENFDVPGKGAGNNSYSVSGSCDDTWNTEYRKDESVKIGEKNGGLVLGCNPTGNSFQYTINVAEAGTFDISATVAANGSGALVFKVGDKVVSDTLKYTGTSWTTFEQAAGSITLDKGEQILTMEVAQGYIDIDWFQISKDGTISIGQNMKLQNNTLQDYRIFDMNGGYIGFVRALGMSELRSKAANLVKCGGAYLARSQAGETLRIQVAK